MQTALRTLIPEHRVSIGTNFGHCLQHRAVMKKVSFGLLIFHKAFKLLVDQSKSLQERDSHETVMRHVFFVPYECCLPLCLKVSPSPLQD